MSAIFTILQRHIIHNMHNLNTMIPCSYLSILPPTETRSLTSKFRCRTPWCNIYKIHFYAIRVEFKMISKTFEATLNCRCRNQCNLRKTAYPYVCYSLLKYRIYTSSFTSVHHLSLIRCMMYLDISVL